MKLINTLAICLGVLFFYSEAQGKVGIGFVVWDDIEITDSRLQVTVQSDMNILLLDFDIDRIAEESKDGNTSAGASQLRIGIGMGGGAVIASNENTNISLGLLGRVYMNRTAAYYKTSRNSDSDSDYEFDIELSPFLRGEYLIGDRFSVAGRSLFKYGFYGKNLDVSAFNLVNSVSLNWFLD